MSASLSVVRDDPPTAKPETVAQRVRRLQSEAKTAAADHIRQLNAAIVAVEELAAEIAEGGDAYPPGIRDLARRLVDDCEARTDTMDAIMARVK